MKKICSEFLMEQFGDEDIVKEIYGEYVRSLLEKITEAKNALAESAWVPLDRVAHAVKGNALAAGDAPMAEVAVALRGAAKLANADDAASLIARLEELSKEL